MRSILIAEDNDEYFTAVQGVFRRIGGVTLIRCRVGEDVMKYLTKPPDGTESTPSMILLDLNMPGTDGHETLVHLKNDPRFRSIPTVVFSSSLSPWDITYCYDQGANGYMNKPGNYEELERNLRTFLDYWKHTMLLPFPPPPDLAPVKSATTPEVRRGP